MASPEQIEAIKLTADWSKWLIAVQTAGVGFVATLLKPIEMKTGFIYTPPSSAKHAFVGGIICFIAAIMAAGALQSSLPLAVTDLQNGQSLWDRGIYFLNREFGKIWMAAELQFLMFLLGIVALAYSAVYA